MFGGLLWDPQALAWQSQDSQDNLGELCSPDSGIFLGEKALPLEKGDLLFPSPLFLLEEQLTCFVSAHGDSFHTECMLQLHIQYENSWQECLEHVQKCKVGVPSREPKERLTGPACFSPAWTPCFPLPQAPGLHWLWAF